MTTPTKTRTYPPDPMPDHKDPTNAIREAVAEERFDFLSSTAYRARREWQAAPIAEPYERFLEHFVSTLSSDDLHVLAMVAILDVKVPDDTPLPLPAMEDTEGDIQPLRSAARGNLTN